MLARSNLISGYMLNAICSGTGGAVGAACPNFGAVWTVPPNRQPEQKSFIFISFVSVKKPKVEK